jgi:hypothetical protein
MNLTIQHYIEQKSSETDINKEILYSKGMDYLVKNIEYYFDKPYSCDSVLIELFQRGITQYIKNYKTQSK